MASVEGQASSSILEGWEKWQIALAVGAPVCLGLAGLWYYNRSNQNDENAKKPKQPKPASPEKANSSKSSESEKTPIKPDEDTPLAKAQAAKNKGNKYFKGAKYDEAIKCYQQAITICPEDKKTDLSTFYANMAAAFEKLKNPRQVIENCTEALKLNSSYVKALSRRANAAELIGDLQMSLEDVTAVCILESFSNTQTLQTADRVLKALGKDKAKEALKNKKPGMPSKHFLKSYFASFTHDPIQTGLSSSDQEQKIENTDPSEKVQVTVEDVDENKPQVTVEDFDENKPKVTVEDFDEKNPKVTVEDFDEKQDTEEVEAANKQDSGQEEKRQENGQLEMNIPVDGPYTTAVIKLREYSYEDVIPLCTKELESMLGGPYCQLALLLRGTMYCLTGQQEAAFTDLNELLKAEELDTNIKVNALIKRGGLNITKELQTEGLADFAQAVRVDSNNSDIYHHRGFQNIQLDRLEDAIRDFENSIKKNPGFPLSYIQKSYAEHRRAAAEQSTTKLQNAIKSYEETLKKFPNTADGHALYAQALCDLGRFEDADKEFETAIKLEPDNANTLVHRALLRLQWKQETDEPVKLIKKAIELDNKCEYAYEILGTIEVQRGDMVNAVKLFERAIELCRTEAELSQLFSLLHAAKAQLKAAQTLGIPLPANFSPM